MTRRRWWLTALASVAFLLIAGRLIADTYADYVWFDALGATSVWSARMETVVIGRTLAWIVATVFALAHFLTVRQSVASLVVQRRVGDLEIGENVHGRYLTGSTIALSVVVGAILALVWNDWVATLLASSGSGFREFDPYFGSDLGFFVYWLPFEAALWNWSLIVVVAVIGVVAMLYVLTDSLRWEKRRLRASSHARRHLTVMTGLVLLMLAWRFRLAMYETLLQGGGAGGMFDFIDHRVRVPGLLVLCLVTLGAGLCVVVAGIGAQFRLAGNAVIGVIGLWVVVRQILPPVVSHLTGDRDARGRDAQYVATEAAYTRRGFSVDRMGQHDSTLQFSSLAQASSHVAVWDAPAIRRTLTRIGASDSGTSWIQWKGTPAALIAEVATKPSAEDQDLPWLVTTFRATTPERSDPQFVASTDLASQRQASDPRSLRPPVVYPGATGYAIVPDTLHRVSGVSLERVMTRVAYAWNLQNLRLIARSLPALHATLVTHRDVRDRLDRLVPFLSQGSMITPMFAGDSLYWMVDLYSASAWYPLSYRISVPQGKVGYFQHAAVAVLNATTGDVSLVPDSVLDPIAITWKNRFPGLFGSWSALPPSLRNGVPPAVDGARAQAIAFGRVRSGIEGDNLCQLPARDGSDSVVATRESFFEPPSGAGTAVAFPLIDDNDRVCGAVIGIGGLNRRTVWQPSAEIAPHWSRIVERLRTADSVGSPTPDGAVVRGAVRVVPVGDHFAYVQPAYTWRVSDAPTLAYVAYVQGDTTRRVTSLAALIAGGEAAPLSSADVLARAATLWTALQDAARRGDWVEWGRTLDSLGRVLGARIRP
jgi:uncharacterized protein